MRLQGKSAIIIGAGQGKGETVGCGRATALRFAQEGARVMAVDRYLDSAEETASMIRKEGGECITFKAEAANTAELKAAVEEAHNRWGRIDILDYNVGIQVEEGGDSDLLQFTEEAFERMFAVNLRGAIMATKFVIPIMRRQRSGCILMISSVLVYTKSPFVGYKASKAGMNAFANQVAIQNAEYGIRANTILPGYLDTPMAVDGRSRMTGVSRAQLTAEISAKVPLRKQMGTGWDVANAALFLASDEANFITGTALAVDGGYSLKIG